MVALQRRLRTDDDQLPVGVPIRLEQWQQLCVRQRVVHRGIPQDVAPEIRRYGRKELVPKTRRVRELREQHPQANSGQGRHGRARDVEIGVRRRLEDGDVARPEAPGRMRQYERQCAAAKRRHALV